jgi:hypothetical protein
MQAKDNEIEPKGKEIECEKTTPKESTDLTDEEIIEINFEMFLKTPEANEKIDLSVKGIFDEESPETNDCRFFPPVLLSQRMKDFLHRKIPGEGKL